MGYKSVKLELNFLRVIWNLEYGSESSHEVKIRPVWAAEPEDTQVLLLSNVTQGDTIVRKIKNLGESDVILVVDEKDVVSD